ncbi:MAG: 1,4-alpha-glucan branching protein GlgB, partial [Candidatus Omnitrophica bacterium]|nr:1,4-alpha-glucan branching protein GlgB [Candidatus Omnitrophota bacterium]
MTAGRTTSKQKQYSVQTIPTFFSKRDIQLFKQGNHFQLYRKLGAHPKVFKRRKGFYFSVWAPSAKRVAVVGDFNQWNKKNHVLVRRTDGTGIWEGFIPGIQKGDLYKFDITATKKKYSMDKGDPFARLVENAPGAAAVAWSLQYSWKDQRWMRQRSRFQADYKGISIYEVHLGSWRRKDGRFLTYKELRKELVPYVKRMGFTHVEFLPVTEHPYYGSWGYQPLSFFAPTSRYGTPQDFMALVDAFHEENIGVILDWVPSHFPSDRHGLVMFDGTPLYETGEIHPDWRSYLFNNGRREVVDFLISSALFWLEKYHIDGIRVDAVASMLYLDYSRKEGEWEPNFFGGHENLDAIAFLRKLNAAVKERYPEVLMIAEESSVWPKVSGSVKDGGLGFDMKWNMGWMHDTLQYFYHQDHDRASRKDIIANCLSYAFHENFLLPLSHDEVVHEKSS